MAIFPISGRTLTAYVKAELKHLIQTYKIPGIATVVCAWTLYTSCHNASKGDNEKARKLAHDLLEDIAKKFDKPPQTRH